MMATGTPGEVVHWKRGQLLGSGSFGKVYAGLDLRSGASIAVKQVRLPNDPTSKRRMKEVKVQSCGGGAEFAFTRLP